MTRPVPDVQLARIAATAAELRIQMGRLKRRLREQADSADILPSQVDVVLHLGREGAATITSLAKAAGMRSQSMGANVAALEAAGLVSGAPDPDDGRQTLWSLTPHCREWIAAGRAAREDWLSRVIQKEFSTAEQAELARAVELLKRIADS